MIFGTIRFKFFSVLSLVFVIGGSVLAKETPVSPQLYGSWEAMKLEQAGMTIRVILVINENQVTVSSACSFSELSVLAEVSSPAIITGNEIRVLESKHVMKEYSPGFLQCKASLKAETMQYQIRDGKLALTSPQQPQTVELPRVSR